MTRLHTLLTTCFCLALLTVLGAGPATQPTEPQGERADLRMRLGLLQQGVKEFKEPVAPPSIRGGMPMVPGRRVDPQIRIAPRYQTPRREWIPRQFNGLTFYLIPCDAVTAVANPSAERTTEIVVPATAEPSK